MSRHISPSHTITVMIGGCSSHWQTNRRSPSCTRCGKSSGAR